jgi:hypothetical protein
MSRELDVNYLLHRQQISLIRAQAARSDAGRAAYEGLAAGYAQRVRAYRRLNERRVAGVH